MNTDNLRRQTKFFHCQVNNIWNDCRSLGIPNNKLKRGIVVRSEHWRHTGAAGFGEGADVVLRTDALLI